MTRSSELALINTRFDPYAAALAGLVDERIDATGHAVILDIHSYPRDPLPYELFADEARPEICFGCDEDHTPAWLRALARDALAPGWGVGVNGPFRGLKPW
jgi:N-formylglutamate deformylase